MSKRIAWLYAKAVATVELAILATPKLVPFLSVGKILERPSTLWLGRQPNHRNLCSLLRQFIFFTNRSQSRCEDTRRLFIRPQSFISRCRS